MRHALVAQIAAAHAVRVQWQLVRTTAAAAYSAQVVLVGVVPDCYVLRCTCITLLRA